MAVIVIEALDSFNKEVEVLKVIDGADSFSVIMMVSACVPFSVALPPETVFIATIIDSLPS